MSEQDTTSTTTEGVGETSANTSTEATATEATTETTSTEGEAALGDAGKKALDAMKAKWKDADKLAKDNAAALAALQAKLDGKEAEHAAQQDAQRVKDEALAAANAKIRNAEIKAAAKGVLADPTDALTFLNLDEIEVSEDGDVDAEAVKAALDKLIETKPYLAVQDGKRFQGGADAGTRNEARPAQLSEQEVKRLAAEGKHDEIVKAKAEGRLADYLAS